jgi:hypothetical protein
MSQVLEHLPSKSKALSSNPNTTSLQKKPQNMTSRKLKITSVT